jgi:PP-loop superfamily ATP-utilizing enzyme
MFQFSPIHDNTDAQGMYRIVDGGGDSVIQVYYPGMKMAYVNVKGIKNPVNIRLKVEKPRSVGQAKAQATEWFDLKNDHPHTFCNPVNISYNFEFYNNNVKSSGSFRSSADPMLDSWFLKGAVGVAAPEGATLKKRHRRVPTF